MQALGMVLDGGYGTQLAYAEYETRDLGPLDAAPHFESHVWTLVCFKVAELFPTPILLLGDPSYILVPKILVPKILDY